MSLPPSFSLRVPMGEDRERRVCDHCGFIEYVNPRIVVGTLASRLDDGVERILMCRRAIAPRVGFWTLPAGYMELGETVAAAALREAREEAMATLEIDAVLAVYSLPHIGQVQIMHRATLLGDHAPGVESLETALFRWEEIPWDELAFPSVRWALEHWRQVRGVVAFPPFLNPDPARAAPEAATPPMATPPAAGGPPPASGV